MRTITMRQFARHLSKELKDLPVTVTKNDEPVIVVYKRGEIHECWCGKYKGKGLSSHNEMKHSYNAN